MDDEPESAPGNLDGGHDFPKPEGRISLRAALLCYAALGIVGGLTTSGTPRWILLLVLGALAIKSWLEVVRRRLQ